MMVFDHLVPLSRGIPRGGTFVGLEVEESSEEIFHKEEERKNSMAIALKKYTKRDREFSHAVLIVSGCCSKLRESSCSCCRERGWTERVKDGPNA